MCLCPPSLIAPTGRILPDVHEAPRGASEECHLTQRFGVGIFLQAMREGEVQLAHVILGDAAANASLDSKGAAGRTLLMCASMLPHASERICFMQLLLGRGVDVQRQDAAGRTALSLASEHGYLDAVALLVFHDAHPGTPDNKGKSPLDYAVAGHHDDVANFLLNELKRQDGHGKLDMQTGIGQKNISFSDRSVSGEVSQSPSQSLCRKIVNEQLLTDHVICNPCALEEEKRLSQYDYRKHSSSGNNVPSLCEMIENPDFLSPTEKPSPCQTGHFVTMVNSKSGFLSTWIKRSSKCPSNSLSTEQVINKPSDRFSKRMASKMTQSITTSSLRESRTNLLILEGEVMDSGINKTSYHSSEKKLQNTLTDTVLQNRCFLEKSSHWVEPTEGFLQNCYRKWVREKLYPDHITRNRLPEDKYLCRMRNTVQLPFQSKQNTHTRSGCDLFRALRRRTNPELKFLHMGQMDPEQEALVNE
ncbi:hypothetical protein AOLI_G00294470 [Acnodon oligacanthus]